jgi:DNA polymerase-1
VDWELLRTRLPDGPEVRAQLAELGLRQVLGVIDRLVAARDSSADVPSTAATAVDPWDLAARGYLILSDDKSLRDYIDAIPEHASVSVDTETDSLRPDRARLVGVSLAVPGLPAAYVPVRWRVGRDQGTLFPAASEQDRLDPVRRLLAPLLADPAHEKVGQNLKYDEWILSRHGMPLAGPRFDTMLASYVLDPGRQRHGLDDLAADHLGHVMLPYDSLFAAGDRVRDILDVPQERLAVYAAEDAEIALRLRDRFAADLAEVPALDRLFRTLETPLSEVLFRMEQRGIRVDTAFLAELGVEFRTQMDDLERRIHTSAGRGFNVQSPKQLAEILFDELGLKPTRKTASGWSTDVSVLTALAGRHPLPGLILEHRQLAKLLGTYVEAVTALVEPDTGLLHTSFNQAVAATGRLSSSDPNLQNIPVRTTEGRRIRQAFVPRDAGHVFLSADYSQIELRLLAHLSGDAALVETFRRGGDVHRRTAALIAGVGEDAVDGVMRSRAKAINFGVIYGMGARALARQIDVSVREASGFIDDYFRTYPGVREYIEHCRVAARETGYAETLLGRRRTLPEILSDRDRERSFAERIAVNTPIQGTAADLIKLAMLEVDRRLTATGSGALLLLQVHDELLLEVAPDELAATEALVREAMEGVMALSVPLVVDLHAGANWAEAHG